MFRLEYTNVIFDSRVLREAETLSEYHQVHIIDVLGDHSCKKEQKGDIQIERIELKSKSFSSTLFFKVLKYIEFLIKASLRGVRKNCDVYHAHDLPALLPALIAGKWNRAIIIYDSHELWTEMGHMSEITKKIAGIIERVLISKINKVIVANRSRALIMKEKYRNIETPEVIMNCPSSLNQDCSKLSSRKLPEFLLTKGLENKRIVLYQGGLMPDRGLEELVLSAKNFLDDVVLIFIGEGNLKKLLQEMVIDQGLEKRVFFHNYIPYMELLSYTASADVGVVIYKNTCMNNYYCAPNKLFEYATVGLPVAACNFPELEAIVKRYNIGKLFDPDDPISIANAINNIFNSQKEYDEMKQNTHLVRHNFNWETEEKKLLKIYKDLLKV